MPGFGSLRFDGESGFENTPRIVIVCENSIKDINAHLGVSLHRKRLVTVGLDPDLFNPFRHVARVPALLITTATSYVALRDFSCLLDGTAKLRIERG